jgi:hypothetical protein
MYVVGVCYHLAPQDLERRLSAVANRLGIQLLGVIVSNAPLLPDQEAIENFSVVQGSNEHLDFSGYFEGLTRLLVEHPEAAHANVLFVNDSLFTKHPGSMLVRRVMNHDVMVAQMQLPAICGKRDLYRSVSLRNPWSGDQGYIASFCFLLNGLALTPLRKLNDDATADGVITSATLVAAEWGAKMPSVLREQIRAHLVYRQSPERWHGLNAADPILVAKKARCVYFEHRLSGVIGSTGAVIPINAGRVSSVEIFLKEGIATIWRRWR